MIPQGYAGAYLNKLLSAPTGVKNYQIQRKNIYETHLREIKQIYERTMKLYSKGFYRIAILIQADNTTM